MKENRRKQSAAKEMAKIINISHGHQYQCANEKRGVMIMAANVKAA
jgi:hypothetical protein